MSDFSIRGPDGEPIDSLATWFEHAPPKRKERHWVAGRSAMELARRWCAGVLPPEIEALLATSPSTRGLRVTEALAEHVTRLDEFAGEGRNHDLLLSGVAGSPPGPVVVGIEGKAGEPFGSRIGPYLRKLAASSKPSNAPERIRRLCRSVLGAEPAAVGRIRYQLLTATAGTAIEAAHRGAALAVLIVHELRPGRRGDGLDLDAFVSVLSGGTCDGIAPGELVGPYTLPGDAYVPSMPVLVGKAVVPPIP